MGLGPRLELRQSQQLVMTPQLQLAIKLLTLTNVELETYIGDEMERNPLLSTDDGGDGSGGSSGDAASDTIPAMVDPVTGGLDQLLGTPTAGTDAPLDIDYTGEAFHHDSGSDLSDWGAAASNGVGEDNDFEQVADAAQSLVDILGAQASAAFDAAELIIARHIIDLIDDAGYLTENLVGIAERMGVCLSQVEAVLAVIHSFEPTGVGARSLGECLALQAREVDRLDPAMACFLEHLDLVARNDLVGLMRVCQLDREEARDRHFASLVCLGGAPDQALPLHRRDGLGDHRPGTRASSAADPRQVDPVGDVACESAVLDSHVEDQAEHAVDLLDGGRGAVPGQLGDPGLDVTVRDVGEPDPIPLRVDVLAHDPLISRSRGRL